ncbi:glycosyltransferase family 2 protein [Methanobrevibacter olleyae]|uniref:glycosyltransferase family 2 protein n=1 Tax=Methanobrevibacter olleyae TaxID=294671 RepID=UPI001F2DB4E6|nr:glycosyltransferase [Methanobrevibacter olleyae]
MTLDSVLEQTIGIENLEIIIANDCSIDKTKEIIEDYKEKINKQTNKETIKSIHLDKNMGGAYGPRNIALDYVNGEYLMFIDSDDTYPKDACEILYNKIEKYNCDIAFGRYLRHYPEEDIIRKSYTPYIDCLDKPYIDYYDDLIKGSNFNGALGFIWKNIISYFFYGSSINKENNEEIFIKNFNEENKDEIIILKILPSFWSKIYKTELIKKNNIKFPDYVSAEDLNFLLEAYIKSENGILFLNNKVVYNYFMRLEVEDKSITKNINFRLVDDSLKAYKLVSELCDKNNIKNKDLFLNPYLLNWINLWLSRDNSKEENKIFFNEIKLIEKGCKNGLKYKLILKLIKTLLKIKS